MISNHDDLDKILKILRANGAFEFEMNGLKVKLGELPTIEAQTIEGKSMPIPPEVELDRMVGLPVQGLDDPFLTYSVTEPMASEDTEAEG